MRDLKTQSMQEKAATGNADGGADHDTWATAKIKAALVEARAHPEQRVSEDDVWKKFGLER